MIFFSKAEMQNTTVHFRTENQLANVNKFYLPLFFLDSVSVYIILVYHMLYLQPVDNESAKVYGRLKIAFLCFIHFCCFFPLKINETSRLAPTLCYLVHLRIQYK